MRRFLKLTDVFSSGNWAIRRFYKRNFYLVIIQEESTAFLEDLCFFCSRRGKGESEAPGGGRVSFNFGNPRRGVGGAFQKGRGRGAGRVSAVNWGIWGGEGAKYFFRRRNVHQVAYLEGVVVQEDIYKRKFEEISGENLSKVFDTFAMTCANCQIYSKLLGIPPKVAICNFGGKAAPRKTGRNFEK